MKKKKEILRVRPFNMANFSGAGGYIPWFTIYGTIITFPATLLLWTGMAISLKKEDGKLNIAILKRRLIIILLPIYVLSLVNWFLIVRGQTSFYGGSFFGFFVYAALVASIHILGMYSSIYFSGKLQNKRDSFSKGNWFIITFLFANLMLIIGILASIFLVGLAT
jgi:hypothetical protein